LCDGDFFEDFLRLDDLLVDILLLDRLLVDFRALDVLLGTFAPSRRASASPIAIACFRLFTVFPDRPLLSVPRLRSCIARFTFCAAFLPYRAITPPMNQLVTAVNEPRWTAPASARVPTARFGLGGDSGIDRQDIGHAGVVLSLARFPARCLRDRRVAFAEDLELPVVEILEGNDGVVRAPYRTNDLVQLDVDRIGVPVLRVLDQEHHQERNDRGAGIDDELPRVAETEDGAAYQPQHDETAGEGERKRMPGRSCGRAGRYRECIVESHIHPPREANRRSATRVPRVAVAKTQQMANYAA
jgi:hypothetical protein